MQIDKGLMEGKTFITPMDLDSSSLKDKSKALEAVNIIK